MEIKNIIDNLQILNTKCTNVEKIDENILLILDKMLESMYKNKGIGLTANQVGLTKKLVVVDLQENDIKSPIFFINPEIIWKSETTKKMEEGCLSVPFVKIEMERAEKIKVKYLDKKGKENIIEAEGLLAICLQHEIDHMKGITIFNSLSKMKQVFTLKKIKKMIKENEKL